jgi:hypothetical protein
MGGGLLLQAICKLAAGYPTLLSERICKRARQLGHAEAAPARKIQ